MGKSWQRRSRKSTKSTAKELYPGSFEAPTAGLKSVYFTAGSTKDAAEFKDTVEKLLRHVATTAWKQASILSKAMTELNDRVFPMQVRPVRVYISGTGSSAVETTSHLTAGMLNIAVVDDINYSNEMDHYKSDKRKSESSAENWEEKYKKGYNLVLQHCPAELEAELKNQDAWGDVEDTRSVVRLLTLIRYLQYNKTDRKRSIMATVEADFELFAGCPQKKSIDGRLL